MSTKLNTYSFLPWMREGIANEIQNSDGENDRSRATFDMSFDVVGTGISSPVSKPISKTISLYGPGDVIGLDSKAIIKTEPRNWVTNFEPNYLPCIDFYDEDFPWRYSPDIPNGSDRLMPWLALVVLEEDKFEEGKDITNKPLPYVQLVEGISAKDVFQPSEQLWAWAHVHVNRDLITNDPTEEITKADQEHLETVIAEFEKTLRQNPDMAYSRIICPAKLKENTAYHAFLIPAFESGRLAGLGMDVDEIFNADGSTYKPTTLSWAPTDEDNDPRIEPEKFPVYHRWYFRTGNAGDFEYLVRLLEPKPVDSRVGTRDMDVTNPGSNIDGISDDELDQNGELYKPLNGVLRLGGALRVPLDNLSEEERETYEKYENWDQPYPRTFQKQLAAFINLPDEYSRLTPLQTLNNINLPQAIRENIPDDGSDPDPLITSPLYGRWHAMTKRILVANDGIPDANWLHQLNLDPRHRATANFGTKTIQKNQEAYMESAWKQVGDVMEANKRIRQAQLAQAAAQRWYKRYLLPLKNSNEGGFLWLTQPVQSRILSMGKTANGMEESMTVSYQVKNSKVPNVTFSHALRKYSRPGGRLTNLLDFKKEDITVERLVERINNDEVRPAPPKVTPEAIDTIGEFATAIKPQKVPGFLLQWVEKYKWLKYAVLGLAVLIIILLVIFVAPDLSTITPGFGSLSGFGLLVAIFLFYLYVLIRQWEKQLMTATGLQEENQTPEAVDGLPKKPGFKLTVAGEKNEFKTGDSDSIEGSRFKSALRDVNELLEAQKAAALKEEPPALNLDAIATATFETLNPQESIPNYILKNQVSIPERLMSEKVREGFKEAMAYPEIDEPMCKPLLDISADLFLPNINYVSQNSISLLETNQAFIEAYMVGINHEFARELLWREYPTDQRGSYFRQFWDVADFNYDEDDIEKLREVAISKLPADASDEEIDGKLKEEIRDSLKDIPKIHRWSKFSNLGDHDHRENYKKTKLQESSDADQEDKSEVVLVVRGELLKKYPNAVIYAQKAEWKITDDIWERQLVSLDSEELEIPPRTLIKTPLYEAKAEPDIYFFGFDLDIATAKGGSGEGDDVPPGWFFVIKERPGEPRFGLDIGPAPTAFEVWNDLSWDAITPAVGDNGHLKIPDNTNETITITDTVTADDEKEMQHKEDKQIDWSNTMNASDIAYILYQAPVMLAVHATEMLPKT